MQPPPGSEARAIFTPADIPHGARLRLVGAAYGQLPGILAKVRPDLTIADDGDLDLHLSPAALADPPASGLVLPECAGAYYDWWSFPVDLLERDGDRLAVSRDAFTRFLDGFDGFFGTMTPAGWRDARVRYRGYDRPRSPRPHRQAVDSMLADDASRADLAAVLDLEPEALWRHWLGQLYGGMEYMDYAVVSPGDVVINCGVMGGGEVPYFLAAMRGRGTLVNIDPMGADKHCTYTRAALAKFQGQAHNITAAVHHACGTLTLPVEPIGGMAVGNMANKTAAGMESVQFEAVTLDAVGERLALDRIDLIKTDMEGAEPAALRGAIASIRRFRPQLAISIYHELGHFTDIPLYLASELTGYRYFVRSYHFCSNETILYAIPEERPVRPRHPSQPIALV